MNSSLIGALREAASLRGIYTRVANQTGSSVQHVREVGLGRRKSSRVLRAIEREFRKILEREKAA